MAKHSKYDNIKHRKAAQDAKKGKVYSIHAKLITLAAQGEGDPSKNPNLAMLIEKAKKDGVPNDNIDRAIKKGTGEDKSGCIIQEIMYEGYGPSGVAILVKVLTDNKNRTAASIRHIFGKYSGNLGESGSVSWMFKRKGIIEIDSNEYNYDKIEEITFETNAEDIILEENNIKITTSVEDLQEITYFFEKNNIKFKKAEMEYIPDVNIKIDIFDNALKLVKMIEAFNEDEDVEFISTNEDIEDNLLEEVISFIDKNTFKT